jgi:acetyltransferase-like isoleucine patch superfamily enzyme
VANFYLFYYLLTDRLSAIRLRGKLEYYRRRGVDLNFIAQGGRSISIDGDLTMFSIAPTSHLKTGAYINCTGGVHIGRYFHVGRNLTIYSTEHKFRDSNYIPYSKTPIAKPVVIEDFVWIGSNVTILPGVRVGQGAIIAAGSVVADSVSPLTIVGGVPARVIGTRDERQFNELMKNGQYF